MFEWIIKHCIKDYADTDSQSVRARYGTLGAVVGMCLNILLAGGKAFFGFLSGSVAMVADAANNLSDAGGSVMALVFTRIAQKPNDMEHPFGHGRYEYIGALGVGALILLMGVGLLKSGIEGIITPAPMETSIGSVIIMAIAILVKLWMARFYRVIGDKTDNASMRAASKDSLSDVLATGAVLVSVILHICFGWMLDAYLGVLVALLVLKSGYGVISDTVSRLIGGKPDKELGKRILDKLLTYEGIMGVHDFVLHDYGPGRCMASVHAEVSAHSDFVEMHEVIDRAEREISDEMNIPICIHMDPVLTRDEAGDTAYSHLMHYLEEYDPPLKLHDFRMVPGEKNVNLVFDVLAPGALRDVEGLKRGLNAFARTIDPRYHCVVHVDRDYFTL